MQSRVLADIGSSRMEELLHVGIPGRATFMERLDAALRVNARAQSGFSILLIDVTGSESTPLDAAGIQKVVGVIRASTRDTDTIAAFNGREFAVLMAVSNENGVMRVVAKIVESLARHGPLLGDVAMGVALCPTHGASRELLMRGCDRAMYLARRSGRRFMLADRPEDREASYHPLVKGIGSAIEKNEFVLRFQPMVELVTGSAVSREGLARWLHPSLGLLPPSEFLNVAMRDGKIDSLTMKLVHQALEQMRTWRDEGLNLPVSLNLANSTLQLAELERDTIKKMRDFGLAPESLTLELRDEQLMQLPTSSMDTLFALADDGVRLCIDDFGRGAGSLLALRDLPVHEVKIDFGLIASVCRSKKDADIIRALVNLGQDLGKRVVAKGVEREEIRDALVELGCEFGQGFHFSQALDSDAIVRWHK